jgi:Rho guanine nucleotide exchange factor 7
MSFLFFVFSLTTDEYAQLMCNFMEIVECHEDLYVNLEECTNDRVGKIFLAKAPIMKKVHQQYCALHPRAIVIVDKYKCVAQSSTSGPIPNHISLFQG